MANVRKKISELTALTSASLDTVIVGVDNGTTYKIELDVLADTVTNRINTLDIQRLNSLESVTSSFETKGRSVISSSAQITALGFTTSSSDLTSLNSFTSSQSALNTAFTNGISSRLTTSSFESFSSSVHQRILDATNEQSFNGLISGSSQLTSSYDERYIISGSITQTTWDNISGKPNGLVSQSTDLSSINTFTQSIDSRVDSLENWSSSLDDTFATDLQVSIVSSSVAATIGIISQNTGLVSTSSFNQYTASISTASLVTSINNLNTFTASQSTSSLVDRLNVIESVSGSWITENETGSFLTSLDGAISSSSQLTSSFDTRYTFSGSVQPLPSGVISGSSQLTSSFDTRYTLSGSVVSGTTPIGTISSSAQISAFGFVSGSYVTTSSFNAFTSSALTTGSNTFSGSQIITGSLIVSSLAIVNGGVTIPTGSTISLTSGSNLFVDASGGITGSLSGSVFGIGDVVAFSSSVNTRINNIVSTPAGTISGSSQLTSSFDTRYTLSGSVQPLPSGVISGSSQLTSSLDTIYLTIGGDNVISGSSQLTASLDTRYAASGSVGGVAPAGTVSGSSQLTSSLDLRYLVTGSVTSSILQLNIFTSSINVWSSSLATTGSNTFNGNQTITGSLNLTNGNIVASQITANTSSLYLTSGSNLYIQNNGIAEISGSLLVSGSTTFTGSISISSGSITMPNRPAFRVTGAGGGTTAVTTLSGSMTTIDFNQANCWDNTTGTFTAPIAGLYQVNLVCRTNSNSSSSGQIIVYKNNTGGTTGTPQVMIEWAANTTMNHAGGSTISKLAVGDTLKAVVAVGTLSFDGNDNFSVAYIG
jgi:hypothetical protein